MVSELQSIIARDGYEVAKKLGKSSNDSGETPLLLAIKGNHKEMVKFLVRELKTPFNKLGRLFWNGADYEAVTPLFAAIVSGQYEIVAILLEENILEYLSVIKQVLKSNKLSRLQKIDTLELMGAAFFLHCTHFYEALCQEVGLLYWKYAMKLRYSTKDNEPDIPKTAQDLFSQKFFRNASELTTMEELDAASRKGGIEFFKIQALLVCWRILNRMDPRQNHFFLNHFYEHAVQRLSNQLKMDAFAFILEEFYAR